LEGRLRQNNYTSSNGMKINSLEVLVNKVDLIGGRSSSQSRATNAGPNEDLQSQQNNFSNPYYGNSSYGQHGSAPYSPLNGYTHQVPDPEEQPEFPIDSSNLPF
jgi:single-stranded DNA-binding protein